jgi:Arc/MetJ-type ribon-helix-helix transcriptional regulator
LSDERKFRSVSLSNDLVSQVEDFIKENPEYKSIADFICESTRLRLQQLEKLRKGTLQKEG